jgi:hypothetical protein
MGKVSYLNRGQLSYLKRGQLSYLNSGQVIYMDWVTRDQVSLMNRVK